MVAFGFAAQLVLIGVLFGAGAGYLVGIPLARVKSCAVMNRLLAG
jgi:hypothetical protein